jgi:hypothetical protein
LFIKFLVRVVFGLALFASSVALAVTGLTDGGLGLWFAAAVVALAAVIQTVSALESWLGVHRNRVSEKVEAMLRIMLVDMYREDHFDCDFPQVSVHVWEVPAWYRRIFPFGFRKWLRRLSSGDLRRRAVRPKLVRVASFRFEQQGPLDVWFKKGEGLIGTCLLANDKRQLHTADFRTPEYQAAIVDEDSWRHARRDITMDLQLEDARLLANRYGQAAALVIQTDKSEAIGCLTLEIPPEANELLEQRIDIKREMRKTADLVCQTIDI